MADLLLHSNHRHSTKSARSDRESGWEIRGGHFHWPDSAEGWGVEGTALWTKVSKGLEPEKEVENRHSQ